MAITIKEVEELQKQKKILNDSAISISQNASLSKEEKRFKIEEITNQMYDIDQEIIRLKNIPGTIEYKESINPILFVIGAIGIFILIKGKK